MARVIIQPQTAGNLKNLIKLAVENQMRVINSGIAKTKRKLGELEITDVNRACLEWKELNAAFKIHA